MNQTNNNLKLDRLYGILELKGEDVREFLHGQLSADIINMAIGQSRLAAYCDPDGRVLAVVLVYCAADDQIFVILNRLLAGSIAQRLQKFILRARVEVIEISRHYQIFGAHGQTDIQPAVHIPLPEPADRNLILYPANLTLPAEFTQTLLDESNWRRRDIELGLCWLNPATSGRFLPQMLGLLELAAVSFDKGCYPGQEVIAKIHYRGAVKRRLIPVTIEGCGALECPAEIVTTGSGLQERKAGWLIDGVTFQDDLIKGLAVLNTNVITSDQMLSLTDGRHIERLHIPGN